MIEIEYSKDFEKLDKIADELLSEYDAENGVEYNFNKFSFVAKDDDKLVGFITGFSYYSEVTINNVVVRKEYRGKGIGIKLIRKVEKYFEGKGFNNINLVTNDFQAPKFYEKCGFELEFVRKNKSNPKLTKYFFVKYLWVRFLVLKMR